MSDREETEPIELLNPTKIDKADFEERLSKLHGTSLGMHNDGWDGPDGEETEPKAIVLSPEEADSGDYDDV